MPCPPGEESAPIDPVTKLRECSACPFGKLQWREAQPCTECPSQGVDCSRKDAIKVWPDFYRPDDDDPTAARCPMRGACKGGRVAGFRGNQTSCSVGHTGPLCGHCSSTNATDPIGQRYYRGASACKPCPNDFGAAAARTAALMIGALFAGTGIFLFLHRSHPLGQGSSIYDDLPQARRLMQALLKNVPQRLTYRASTLAKITLGHLQVMGAFERLQFVRWPPVFRNFLQGIEIDLQLELLPYDCISSSPLTHTQRLLLNLLLPLAAMSVYLLMNALSVFLRTRRRAEAHELNTPSLWTLAIWTVLLLYPSVCRNTLETFSCIELRERFYLAIDTSIECYTDSWSASAALSVIGICLYVVGAPIGLWLAARRYHACSDTRVQRVSLLINSYKREAWFFEVVDLARKLILASIILLAWAGTRSVGSTSTSQRRTPATY